MISAFRRMLDGPGKWVVVFLLVAAFAFFGVPSLDNFRPTKAIEVGDQVFTVQDVDQQFKRALAVEQQQQGRGITQAEAIEQGLLDRTITQIIAETLAEEEARSLGVVATDEMVSEAVRESGAFDDPRTGEFSPQLFAQILQQNGLPPSVFREEIRDDLVRTQLTSALGGASRAPGALADGLVLRSSEVRDVETAVVSAEDAGPPAEDALRSFYAANADRYTAPETRTFRALLVDEETLARDVEVPEEDVRALYEARAATLGTPERRSFRQAIFPGAEAAEVAATRVATGENLGDVARDLGVSATYQADQARADIVDPAVAEAVFGPEGPGVVGPVQGTFGTVVAEVEAVEPGAGVPFEEAREELEAELRAEVAQGRYLDAVEEVELARDEGATLEDAANAAGLPAPRRYGPVDRDLFTPEGAIEDVPGAVARSAFELGLGDESGAIDLDEGGYAFVAVDEVTPAAARPFDEVEARVLADYEAEARGEALAGVVAAFEEAARGEGGFAAAAEAAGSDVQTRTISARRADPTLPRDLLEALFSARIGETVSAETPDGQAVVARVTGVRFGADPSGGTDATLLREQLGQAIATELVNSYLGALQEEIGVERNDALIREQFVRG